MTSQARKPAGAPGSAGGQFTGREQRQPARSELAEIQEANKAFIDATFERTIARKKREQAAREIRDAELRAAKEASRKPYDPIETGKRLMAEKIAAAERGNYDWRTGQPLK